MALENGYIKIHRKITGWRWYKKPLTKHLFEHLLIIANIKDSDFEKITIKRGECVASIRSLAADTGLSEREVRTALKHLKETQEVTQTAYSKYSVFTVNNYDFYQTETQTETSKRHTNDTQATSKRQHNKKDKNDKKNKEEKEYIERELEKESIDGAPPPPAQLFKIFGEYRRVELTEELHNLLISEFGESVTAEYIKRVDEWCQQHNRKYDDYYSTIRKWIREDIENNGKNEYSRNNEPRFTAEQPCKYSAEL